MCPANELTPNGVDCGLATVIDRQLADGCRSGAARVIKDVIDNTPDMTRAARRLFGKSVTATACGPSSLIRRPTTTWPPLCWQKPTFSMCATPCWAEIGRGAWRERGVQIV